MGVYKCQECSHETISADRPAECDICGSIDFMLLGEKKTKLETPDTISKNFTTPAPVSSPSSSSPPRKSTPASVSSPSSSSRLRKSTPAPVSSPFSSSPPRKSTITRIAKLSYNLTLRPLAQVLTWVYRQPGMLATGAVFMIGLAGYWNWQSQFDTSAFNKTVLNENFTSPNKNDWLLTQGAVMKDGGLFQLQPKINYSGWSIWTRQSFTDVDFSADVIKVNGPNDVAFGIIVRASETKDKNFYYLQINGNGYFVMGKQSQEKWDNQIGWKKSNLIKRGNNKNNPNRLRIVCKGNMIMGFINNEMVGSFIYKSFNSGKVAVESERGKGNAVAVYFDNIIIKEKGEKD